MPKTKIKSKVNKSIKKQSSNKKRILQIINPTRRNITIASIVIFGAVGTILYLRAQASIACGVTVENYNYQVPFGKAIWNQPICGLPRHPQSANYASRLFNWGNVNDGSPEEDVGNGKIRNNPGFPDPNNINPLGGLFTREVYYASKATTEKQIATISYYSNLDGENVKTFTPQSKIPWNPKWEASQGGDNEMMILDDRKDQNTYGRIYFLSGYYPEFPKFPFRKTPPVGCNAAWQQNRLCTYRTSVARDLQGNYIDYRTYEGFVKDRGVGLSYLATLTLPEEVEAGEIRHALGIAIPNTSFGPECTKTQLASNDWNNTIGKTCGTAVAPATKFEHGAKTTAPTIPDELKSLYSLDKTIPEGMRFGLDVTYEEIDQWIQSRSDLVSNPRRAETVRIFARAMKDYGMIVVDTNGGSTSIQTAGGINPDNAKKWTDLGMGPKEKQRNNEMFKGLITASNLYVVDTPVATCTDGNQSKYYCDWTKISYSQGSGSTSNPVNTPPTVDIEKPLANTSVSGTVDISVTVTGKNPIKDVQFSVAGNLISNDNTAPYTYRLDSRLLKNGPYTITVKATDTKNLSASQSITIKVNNPTPNTASDEEPPTSISKLARNLRIDITKFRYVLDLTWGASQDASGIREYQITRIGGPSSLVQTTKTTSFTDKYIEPGVRYSYSVVAVDNAGIKSLPSVVDVKGNCLLIWCSLE